MSVAKACVFAAFVLIFFPRFFVVAAQRRAPGGYDNAMPREQQARLDDAGKRAQAAHLNAFEAFAPFAAAVLLAVNGGERVNAALVNVLAVVHVVLRVAYTLFYVANMPSARSTVWIVSTAATAALFVVAVMA